MTVTIKRYPNRKLYNTVTKHYITLEGIATLIREGQEVQVVDNASGDDLTTLTLTQIIFEQEKKQNGFLPKSVLTGLIQSGGQKLGSLRRSLGMPMQLLPPIESEIDRRLQELINRGEMAVEEGARLRKQLLGARWNDFRARIGLPPDWEDGSLLSAEDMKMLYSQLDALTEKVNSLLQSAENKDTT